MSIAALIAGGIGFGNGPSYIPTRGLSFNTQPIILSVVAVDRFLGNPTLLNPGTSQLLYRVFIAGVDRTEYVRVGAKNGPGIQRNLTTSGSGTCMFTVNGWTHDENYATVPLASQYIPSELDEVQILKMTDGLLIFRGTVDTIKTHRFIGANAIESAITCVAQDSYLDRRIVGLAVTGAPFDYFADVIVAQIFQQFLQDTGLTFVYTSAINALVGPQLFPYITAREALNQLAQQTNTNIYVDTAGNVRFADLTAGYTAAPEDITDTTENVLDLTIQRTRVRFANRWYAKSNQFVGFAVQTDTSTVTFNGQGLFILSQSGPSGTQVPQVTVNGVPQRVIPFVTVQPNDTSWDFYYTGVSVIRNWRVAPLSIGDVVDIIYPSPLPWVAVAEDTGSIAAVGLVEDTIEAGDVESKDTLQAIADQALERGKEIPIVLTIKTRTDGYDIGQRFNVTRTDPPISDDFIVTAVSSREINQDYFEHTVTCTNKSAQLASDPTKFAADIIKNLRMTTYNIIEHITFNLAVTVTGLTNPGLAVGIPPAIKTAQKKGTAGWVTLIFNSLSQIGNVTTQDIVIDMYQNGTSIFGTTKLTLPAGFSGEVKFSIFASDPLAISIGDVFTCEILSADDQAYDGVMDLVSVG